MVKSEIVHEGYIRNFDGGKGYGFIECYNFNKIIFFHITNFRCRTRCEEVFFGMKVAFTVEKDWQGRYVAKNVEFIK